MRREQHLCRQELYRDEYSDVKDLSRLPLYEFRFGATFEPVDLFGRVFQGLKSLVEKKKSTSNTGPEEEDNE